MPQERKTDGSQRSAQYAEGEGRTELQVQTDRDLHTCQFEEGIDQPGAGGQGSKSHDGVQQPDHTGEKISVADIPDTICEVHAGNQRHDGTDEDDGDGKFRPGDQKTGNEA